MRKRSINSPIVHRDKVLGGIPPASQTRRVSVVAEATTPNANRWPFMRQDDDAEVQVVGWRGPVDERPESLVRQLQAEVRDCGRLLGWQWERSQSRAIRA